MSRLLVLVMGIALLPFTPVPLVVPMAPMAQIEPPLLVPATPTPESHVAGVEISVEDARRLVIDCSPAAANDSGLVADCSQRWAPAP